MRMWKQTFSTVCTPANRIWGLHELLSVLNNITSLPGASLGHHFFINTIPFSPHNNSTEAVIASMLQMRKLRPERLSNKAKVTQQRNRELGSVPKSLYLQSPCSHSKILPAIGCAFPFPSVISPRCDLMTHESGEMRTKSPGHSSR